jgi:two-component system, OmpR family, response regulator
VDRRTALVVEDDAEMATAIGRSLELAGFEVTMAATGQDAMTAASQRPPDLVTLDLSLPDVDGLEVCRHIRTASDCYVIMVSARHDEGDRLTGLEYGADDFLTKPFSLRELNARVAALFRRPRSRLVAPVTGPVGGRAAGTAGSHLADEVDRPEASPRSAAHVLDCGSGLQVDPQAREVTIHGTRVHLTRTEFDLLAHLASRPGVVVGRREVLRSIWSTEFVPEDTHNVDVHLANLRRKLRRHSSASWIRTVRGVGLRLDRG